MNQSRSRNQRRDRRARPERPSRPRPFTGECVSVYGDDRAPHTRMFPEPAAATVTSPELWTPQRLQAVAL